MVERNAFIIVVMTDTNIVRNRLMRLPSDLTEAQLQLLNTLLNTTFTGLSLEEITPELMRVAQHAAGEAYGLISLVVSFAIEVLEALEQRTVHTSGITHLLELPEYRSLDRAQPLMSYLSDENDPAHFPIPKDNPMDILIGPENVADALKDSISAAGEAVVGETSGPHHLGSRVIVVWIVHKDLRVRDHGAHKTFRNGIGDLHISAVCEIALHGMHQNIGAAAGCLVWRESHCVIA